MKKIGLLATITCLSMSLQAQNVNEQLDEIREKLPQRGSSLSEKACQVELSGDFLYWISNQDAIWMATTEKPPAFLSSSNIFSKIKVLNQRFEYDPGFRIAAAYYWNANDWENRLSWTRYRTSSTGSHSVGNNELVISSWGFASRVNQFTIDRIWQNWQLDYDIIDFTLISHNFNYKKVAFSPTFGLRGAFIKQRVKQEFTVLDLPPFFVDGSGEMKGESDFNGLGVLGSTKFEFKICHGFNLFANLLASLNWGHFETVQNHTFFVQDEPLTGYKPKDKNYRVRANAEMQLGLSWERCFAKDRTRLSLALAYEQIIWLNMNSFKRYFSEEGAASVLQFAIVDLSGDLTLRGLTARAGLAF